MPIEGMELIQLLEREQRDARVALSHRQAEAANLDGRATELLNQRGEALLELARHYLPEVSRPAIERTFEGIRGDLLGILSRKEKRQRELRSEHGAQTDEANKFDAELADVTKQLGAKTTERERLEVELGEVLKDHADYHERSRLAQQAEQQLRRNEERVSEMKKESTEKLPHYERSALFRYLYRRHYGTPEYHSKGLILELDRWVAGLIRFNEARAGYEFLKTTPALVGEEVERRRAQFNELMQQVEAIKHGEADKVGLTAAIRDLNQLGTQRTDLSTRLDHLRQAVVKLKDELDGLDKHENAFYTEALGRFGDFLGNTQLALLEARARRSPEHEDDAIVAQLSALDRQLDSLKQERDEVAAHLVRGERLREGLDHVVRLYKQASYDSDRSYFDDSLDPEWSLQAFRTGESSAEDLWSAIRARQRFRPLPPPPPSPIPGNVFGPAGPAVLGPVFQASSPPFAGSPAFPAQPPAPESMAPPVAMPMPEPASMPAPAPPPPPPPAPAPSEGGFTTVDGF